MKRLETFLKELQNEAVTTRKMLERIPEDKYDWQPHPKSMTMIRLATHVAELPSWVELTLTTDELDFATAPYTPLEIKDNKDLQAYFEKSLKQGETALKNGDENVLEEPWTLREGDKIYSRDTKAEVIRMSINQIVHHRAQLGVYLRLLNIPIPGSYGPSADETEFAVVDTVG